MDSMPGLPYKNKKRQHDDSEAEEILNQICNKMKDLTTSASVTDTRKNDEIVAAFISVLNCTSEEATFFLESAMWNIESAIHFWLDSDKGYMNIRYNREDDFNSNTSSSLDFRHSKNFKAEIKYVEKKVIIPDLPAEWTAWVRPDTGSIYFIHGPSGHEQSSVPPGYADVDAELSNNQSAHLSLNSKGSNSSSTSSSSSYNHLDTYYYQHGHNMSQHRPLTGSMKSTRANASIDNLNETKDIYFENSTTIFSLNAINSKEEISNFDSFNHNISNHSTNHLNALHAHNTFASNRIQGIQVPHISIQNTLQQRGDDFDYEATESIRADCDSHRDPNEDSHSQTGDDADEENTVCNMKSNSVSISIAAWNTSGYPENARTVQVNHDLTAHDASIPNRPNSTMHRVPTPTSTKPTDYSSSHLKPLHSSPQSHHQSHSFYHHSHVSQGEYKSYDDDIVTINNYDHSSKSDLDGQPTVEESNEM